MHEEAIIQDGDRTITFIDSAILFYVSEDESYHMKTGKRHSDIIKTIANLGLTEDYKNNHIDGFFCRISQGNESTLTFISREQSTIIAKKNNYPMIGSILTSEDLW
jgi:hypothetical protein